MKQSDLQRLIKIEEQINRIAKEELGLTYHDIEYDVVDDKKMLELMSYVIPTNFSHWSYGRDYDRLRTIHDEIQANLPLEMVINCRPARAFLSNVNTVGINALVIAHVVGHVHHFTTNKYFNAQRSDIVEYLARATERFTSYERKYGIEEVEPIIDAGMALRFHSSPWDNETDDDKRKRLFEQRKRENVVVHTEFSEFFEKDYNLQVNEDIDSYNSKLWQKMKNTIPVEPTEDILRFIIDHSNILDDWQKDILEVNREVGQYFYANIRNKLVAEGTATYIHQKIMKKLYEGRHITNEDYSQYTYSNSLVKLENQFQINPYYVGCGILEDIEERWDRGCHGEAWEQCTSAVERENWNTGDNVGMAKVLEVIKSYNDWYLLQDFLTPSVIDKLDMYLYEKVELRGEVQLRRTHHTPQQIREIIVGSYSHSPFPSIAIIDGRSNILLKHNYFGMELDEKYAHETMKHINRIWGNPVNLVTVVDDDEVLYKVKGQVGK
jgi:stage V sporulation protein R